MLYRIAGSLMLLSLIGGWYNHRLDQVIASIVPTLIFVVKLLAALGVMMSLWLGLMHIATALGWVHRLTGWIKPLLIRLFPELPPDDPALDYIGLNISANMLGLGNAATPFGLKAMRELSRLNPNPSVASDAMCLFLAINTSSVQLIPIGAVAVLMVGGAEHPFRIVIPILLATTFSTLVGISSAKWMARWRMFKVRS